MGGRIANRSVWSAASPQAKFEDETGWLAQIHAFHQHAHDAGLVHEAYLSVSAYLT